MLSSSQSPQSLLLQFPLRSGLFALALMAPLAAAQDAAQLKLGKKRFLNCNGCHTLTAAENPLQGPHLEGIVGRKAASIEGFEYSESLRELDLVWTEEELDRWLEQPQAQIDELCVPFRGMRKPEDRQALIEWLKQPQP